MQRRQGVVHLAFWTGATNEAEQDRVAHIRDEMLELTPSSADLFRLLILPLINFIIRSKRASIISWCLPCIFSNEDVRTTWQRVLSLTFWSHFRDLFNAG